MINKWINFAYHYTVCINCMLKFKSFILLDVGEISPSKSSGCKCPRSLDSGLVGDHTDFIWSESVLELAVECHKISRLVSKITSRPFVLRQAFKNLLIHSSNNSCRRIKEYQSCEQVIKQWYNMYWITYLRTRIRHLLEFKHSHVESTSEILNWAHAFDRKYIKY